jgi:hypothetical protein
MEMGIMMKADLQTILRGWTVGKGLSLEGSRNFQEVFQSKVSKDCKL